MHKAKRFHKKWDVAAIMKTFGPKRYNYIFKMSTGAWRQHGSQCSKKKSQHEGSAGSEPNLY